MTKSEEIKLVTSMITDTQKELDKDGKDRLHLEGELIQLKAELTTLLVPSHSKINLNRKHYGHK